MQAAITYDEPIFELKGRWNTIDLSAWISGACFACGIWMAGFSDVEAELMRGGFGTFIMAASIAVFFGVILMVQRHMKFALLAQSYGTPKRLVTDGVFKYSRNPIYVAFLLPLASIAAFSAMASIAAIDLYILVMTLTVIRKEERDLAATFGKDFLQYTKNVPRWLVWTREPQDANTPSFGIEARS